MNKEKEKDEENRNKDNQESESQITTENYIPHQETYQTVNVDNSYDPTGPDDNNSSIFGKKIIDKFTHQENGSLEENKYRIIYELIEES